MANQNQSSEKGSLNPEHGPETPVTPPVTQPSGNSSDDTAGGGNSASSGGGGPLRPPTFPERAPGAPRLEVGSKLLPDPFGAPRVAAEEPKRADLARLTSVELCAEVARNAATEVKYCNSDCHENSYW